ncbi:MAG: rod shape-determining protein MreC [Myxococcota bacterium]|nr:rod shape-determining protein MreC [Myxococcales bacterium]
MPDLWRRLGAPIAFGALALLAVLTMVSDRRAIRDDARDLPWWQAIVLEITVPVQKVLLAPVDTAKGAWARYVDLVGVRDENGELRGRIAELEEANLQFREALVASGNLQRIASMRDEFEAPLLPSEIVGLDVSPWFRSVLLDRGGEHGVRSGNPVITDQGVVGLVTATSKRASKTMLLLDRQSAIDGIVQRSRARGIVRGRGTGELEFEFVVRGSDVREGDVVITSGMGGVYPKGLRIGVVRSVSDAGGRLLQTAVLVPSVDFGRLEQVFVVLRRSATMDLLFGALGDADPEPVDAAAASREVEREMAQAVAEPPAP